MSEITNPVKAIRAKCLDCCCNQVKEVELCEMTDCALHPFRFGKNPYRAKREYTEEQLERKRKAIDAANAAKASKRSREQTA